MSKKILSLALAVIMLFSVCAVAVSAGTSADVPSGKIGVRLETNAEVGMAAGSAVWVKLYFDAPVDETVYQQFSNISIAWSTAAYSPATSTTVKLNNDITFSDTYAAIFNTGSAHTTTMGKRALKDADKTAYGWDNAVQFAFTQISGGAINTGTGIPIADYDCEVLTMNFVTEKVLEATDIIGFPTAGYDTQYFRVQTFDRTTLTSSTVALDNLVLTNATPKAAAVKADVYQLSAPRKHADGEKYTVAAFFAFDGAKIAPDFNEAGTSQFIQSISATVTATSGGETITVNPDAIKYVYDLKDGTYGFRVIMKNVPADAEITIVPAVTTDGTAYTVETINFKVADATTV